MPRAGPTRRTVLRGLGVLGAGALGTLAACTSPQIAKDRRPSPRKPDPDLAVVARALAASQDLAQRYAATATAFPDLAGRLGPLAAEHAAHIAALRVSTPTTPPGTTVAPVPTVAIEALAALAAAERTSAAARVPDLLHSAPAVARLLASVAACQAVHAAVLGAAG